MDRVVGDPRWQATKRRVEAEAAICPGCKRPVSECQAEAVADPLFPAAPPEVLKENVLMVADHHRKTCDGASCTVSLMALSEVLRLAGFALTEADIRRLL